MEREQDDRKIVGMHENGVDSVRQTVYGEKNGSECGGNDGKLPGTFSDWNR
jgi:hypothetical protein